MSIDFLRDPYRPGNGPLVQPWIQPLRRNLLTFRRYWTLVSLLTFSLLIGLATFPIQNRWRDLGITLLAVVGYGTAALLFNLADRYTQGSAWQQRLRALRKFAVVLGLTAMHWFLPAASTELWLLYLIPMLTVGVDLDRFWATGLIGFTMALMFLSAWPLPEPTTLVDNWWLYSRNGAIRALIGGYVGATSYLLARSLAYQTNTIRTGLANLLDTAITEPWLNAADKVAGVLATLLRETKRHVTVNVLVYETVHKTMRLIGSSTAAGQQLATSNFVFDAAQGITGWAAQRGDPCFINDTDHDPEGRFLPTAAFPGTRSALAVPIRLDQKRSVVLELESTMPNDVAYEDLQLMQHVGHYLLTAHQRSAMVDFHQRLAQLGTVLAERIIHVKEIGAMLQEIGAVALDLLEADVIRFYYRDPESERIDQRVMLVENDGGMIRSVREAIAKDPQLHFVGYLTGRANLAQFLDEHAPDVAMVDVGLMRDGDHLQSAQEESFEEGLLTIAQISEHSPHTRIIGFSQNFMVLPMLAKEALDHGAHAIIAKQNGPDEWNAWTQWLCAQVHSVLNNWWRMSPEVARLFQDQEEARQRSNPDAPLPLTKRQMDVLRCLASGMADSAIAEKLVIEEGAVRGHISGIRARLQLRYRWQIIEEARRHGLGGPLVD
jgi:DNA-binding NarL/FixJ family response regulator/putative methionine-R-sulfoxide reductase with GAF domain